MSYSEIYEMLVRIEEVISQYTDDELAEKVREAGSDFFQFMTSKGVHPGWCQKLITEQLGFHPRTLHKSQDFALLRSAMYSYAETMGVTPIREKMHPLKDERVNAQETAEFFFGRTKDL